MAIVESNSLGDPTPIITENFTTVTKNVVGFNNSVALPDEPFELVSSLPLVPSESENGPSYAVEYTSNNGRGRIIHLLADTFRIEDKTIIRIDPSPSSTEPPVFGSTEDQQLFTSIDVQPCIASSISKYDYGYSGEVGDDSIKNYTSFYSRPDAWVPEVGGIYDVPKFNEVRHFRAVPFNEEVLNVDSTIRSSGIATFYGSEPNKIYFNTTSLGIQSVDFVIESPFVYVTPNTRVVSVASTYIELTIPHSFVGIATTGNVEIRRIRKSSIDREYGLYFRHYDTENYTYSFNTGDTNKATWLATNTYGFYYGKLPDGTSKKNSESARYNAYDGTGRWGIYIDDEVKNYAEGRVLIGHNVSIGTGPLSTNPEPIVQIFNNKWKDQSVANPSDIMQYQQGLYVENIVGIATRPDTRYAVSIAGTSLTQIVRPSVDNAYTSGADGARWSAVWSANGTIQTSDEREKNTVEESVLGLEFINDLRPVSYKWNIGGREVIDGEIIDRSGERTHWGLIAQEVKKSVDKCNIDFGGWVLEDKNDPNSKQSLRYDQFISPMIKAIQEQSQIIEDLKKEIDELKKRLDT